jgi:integrase
VRPGELRSAEWAEFDIDGAEWRIPAARMKAGVVHLVPAVTSGRSRAARAPRADRRQQCLPIPKRALLERPMSDNTINAALRRLGYAKDQMTGHGLPKHGRRQS